jgi:transcription factor-like protein
LLGVAIRIAQRMGIHSESSLATCTILEAEMRRRLWWSLVLFDSRVSELADHTTTTLAPIWDCSVPLNVNDSDLRQEMKQPPTVHAKCSESLFVVVRDEVGDFIRHTKVHLDFNCPALKDIVTDVKPADNAEGSELDPLETKIEDKYFQFCDPDNSLHFMAIWMTRAQLAKYRLVEHYSKFFNPSMHQTDAQRDTAASYALRILECDTKLVSSPLTKGFLWLVNHYFPFTAYIHLVQDLRRRPVGDLAGKAWEAMSENCHARFGSITKVDGPFFRLFTKIINQAWEARKVAFGDLQKPLEQPRIVSYINQQEAQMSQNTQDSIMEPNNLWGMGLGDFPISMPVQFNNHNLLYGLGGQNSYTGTASGLYSNAPGQPLMGTDVDQLDWTPMNWDLVNRPTHDGF